MFFDMPASSFVYDFRIAAFQNDELESRLKILFRVLDDTQVYAGATSQVVFHNEMLVTVMAVLHCTYHDLYFHSDLFYISILLVLILEYATMGGASMKLVLYDMAEVAVKH